MCIVWYYKCLYVGASMLNFENIDLWYIFDRDITWMKLRQVGSGRRHLGGSWLCLTPSMQSGGAEASHLGS